MSKFLNLPIVLDEIERQPGGWTRTVKKNGSIKDLLVIWNIDNDNDTSEMAQVLRHLKNAWEIIDLITIDQNLATIRSRISQ
jgi:hypothetical protein